MCKELNDLASKHCEDLCENETAGHTNSDGLNLKDRFENDYMSNKINEVNKKYQEMNEANGPENETKE